MFLLAYRRRRIHRVTQNRAAIELRWIGLSEHDVKWPAP